MKHSTKKGKTEHGKTINSPGLSKETERNIDFYCYSVEDHIATLAEQAGDETLVPIITARLVQRLEAKTLWQSFRATQSLPEVRPHRYSNGAGRQPRGSAQFGQAADLPRGTSGRRTLTAEGRERIAEAQRKRWKTVHKRWKTDEAKREYARQYYYKKKSGRVKGSSAYEEQRAALKRREKAAKAAKSYWYNMTPEERSAEISRRRRVTEEKKKQKQS